MNRRRYKGSHTRVVQSLIKNAILSFARQFNVVDVSTNLNNKNYISHKLITFLLKSNRHEILTNFMHTLQYYYITCVSVLELKNLEYLKINNEFVADAGKFPR